MRADALRTWLGAAIPFAASLMLSGCLSGPAPQDRFYRLELPATANRSESPTLQGRLLVDAIRGDAMTLGRLMLYRDVRYPAQVKQEGYAHWIEPPPAMVERAVVEFLRSGNVADLVITPEMHVDADFRLAGRVHRFERVVGDGPSRATVELEFNLVRLEDRELLLLEKYRDEEEVAGSAAGDVAQAFSRALQRILERLVVDLSRLRGRVSSDSAASP